MTRIGPPRGAIAGFNAVVEADSHPDWRVDPATALGPPTEWKGGDLARMLGVQDDVTEMVEPLAIPLMGKDENLSQDGVMPPHLDHDRQVGADNPGGRRFVHVPLLSAAACAARRARDLGPL